jgi:hypothetical protein
MLAMLALHRQLPALACTKLRSKAHMVAVTNVLAKLLRYGKRLTNALATHTHTSPRTEPSTQLITALCSLSLHARPTTATVMRLHRVGIKLQNHTTHEAERG